MRDVVRCRETFQREILKSRHYILKFLARRGFVFREGTNWCTPHLRWPQHLTTEQSPLAPADRLVFREYYALLEYKLQRRAGVDREIERLTELPTLAPMVRRLQCFRGIALQGAMVLATAIVDWRRRLTRHGTGVAEHGTSVGAGIDACDHPPRRCVGGLAAPSASAQCGAT